MQPFLPFPYSPLWGIILAPFSYFTFSVSKQLWYACNLLIVLWFIYSSIRWLKETGIFKQYQYLEIILPVVVFLNFVSIMKTLRTGQGNILVLLFTTLSILCFHKKQKILCGSFLGIAIMTKITPVFLILYWLVKKEFRVVFSAFLSILVLWVISIPFTGIQLQKDYLHWITTYPFSFFGNSQVIRNNMSIFALINDITQTTGHLSFLSITIFALFLLIVLGIWYRMITSTNKINKTYLLLEYGWSLALIPLMTQYTEDHHFVYLCMLYAGILLHLNKKLPIGLWLAAFLAWFLLNCTFFLFDLGLIPTSIYLFQYLYMYGVILAWITGGVMLYLLKTSRDIADD